MIIEFVLTAVVVALCIQFFDKMIALFIDRLSIGDARMHFVLAEIPDALLVIVCLITIIAYLGYRTRKKRLINDVETAFYRHIMYVVPASYVSKTVLKFIFGRPTTREWLHNPGLYGFHWFKGVGVFEGFPSGHMMVFTALAMSLRRFYPGYKLFYTIFLLVLAASLIVTDYHFLSDVVAGAYLGVVLEIFMNRILNRQRLME